MTNIGAGLSPAKAESSERSDKIRGGGDVVFEFVHSALYETSVVRSGQPRNVRHASQKHVPDNFGTES
jgi:hypothetical protein